MNLHSALVSARKLLTAAAVTMVAATCLGSAATSVSASSGHERSDSVSAAKEAKSAPAPKAVTSRTKEW